MEDHFPILFLNARPGAGKSEIIDYLKGRNPEERLSRFHVGDLAEFDDFPLLWAWFEEDAILEEMGRQRLHTDREGWFLHADLWNLLIRRLCLDYRKAVRDRPEIEARGTALVEFSRGTEHGGYAAAFSHVDPAMLERGAILYVDVSWEESLRKNRKRFNPDKPDSVLEHGLSDAKLARLYRHTDWESFSAGDPAFIAVGSSRVPYVVMNNEDDVTSARGEALGGRLEEALGILWERYAKR